MKTFIRLAVAAGAVVGALAFASPALAVYRPQLLIGGTSHALGARNVMVIAVGQTRSDDATAKIDINVPEGYQENLTQPFGTEIGVVAGTVILRGLGDAEVEIEGTVKTDNPATYTSNTCAPGTHTAVWVLDVTIAGTPFRVPIYVDDVTTVPGVSARIQLCLAGPVGTPNGTQLLVAAFTVEGVFTNPGTRGVYTWSGIFTPYLPGTATPNPAGTVEARAIVPVPIRVTIRIKKLKGRGNFLITGKIDIPGNAVPSSAQIWAGPSARRLRRVGTARVRRAGSFSSRRRVKKTTLFQARVDTEFSDANAFGGCGGVSRAPAGCVSSAFTAIDIRSNVVKARVPRRR